MKYVKGLCTVVALLSFLEISEALKISDFFNFGHAETKYPAYYVKQGHSSGPPSSYRGPVTVTYTKPSYSSRPGPPSSFRYAKKPHSSISPYSIFSDDEITSTSPYSHGSSSGAFGKPSRGRKPSRPQMIQEEEIPEGFRTEDEEIGSMDDPNIETEQVMNVDLSDVNPPSSNLEEFEEPNSQMEEIQMSIPQRPSSGRAPMSSSGYQSRRPGGRAPQMQSLRGMRYGPSGKSMSSGQMANLMRNMQQSRRPPQQASRQPSFQQQSAQLSNNDIQDEEEAEEVMQDTPVDVESEFESMQQVQQQRPRGQSSSGKSRPSSTSSSTTKTLGRRPSTFTSSSGTSSGGWSSVAPSSSGSKRPKGKPVSTNVETFSHPGFGDDDDFYTSGFPSYLSDDIYTSGGNGWGWGSDTGPSEPEEIGETPEGDVELAEPVESEPEGVGETSEGGPGGSGIDLTEERQPQNGRGRMRQTVAARKPSSQSTRTQQQQSRPQSSSTSGRSNNRPSSISTAASQGASRPRTPTTNTNSAAKTSTQPQSQAQRNAPKQINSGGRSNQVSTSQFRGDEETQTRAEYGPPGQNPSQPLSSFSNSETTGTSGGIQQEQNLSNNLGISNQNGLLDDDLLRTVQQIISTFDKNN